MGLRGWLFLSFIVVPLIEIYLLVEIGGFIGAPATVFLVVFTAVLGALLLRHQGFYTLQKVQKQMARGEVPAMAMLEGVCLVIGGVLLLTPGFITDSLGFLMLITPTRRYLVNRLLSGFTGFPSSGRPESLQQSQVPHPRRQPQNHHRHSEPTTLDGEFRREDDD